MITANSPVETPEQSPTDEAIAPQERRDSERVIKDWQWETRRLGRALALIDLNVAEMTGEKWANRFVIAISAAPEDCALLYYGAKFAALMELPVTLDHAAPVVAHLPARYVPVFTKACVQGTLTSAPVRAHGTLDREDSGQELYRAAFIPLRQQSTRQQRLLLGAFNRRVIEPRPGRLLRPSKSRLKLSVGYLGQLLPLRRLVFGDADI
jgi:hypothetical protein